MKKCLIVQPAWAHYRLGLLKELEKNSDWEFFYAGQRMTNDNIARIDFSEIEGEVENRFFPLKNNNFPYRKIPLVWQSGLSKILRKNNFDCFIFAGSYIFLSTWLYAFLLRLRGKKVFFWTHGYLKYEFFLKRCVRAFFYSLANHLLLYNERAYVIIRNTTFLRKKPCTVIYNSENYVAIDKIRSNRQFENTLRKVKSNFKNPNLPVVIAIGRLTKVKNLHLIFRCLPFVKTKFNLVFVGDGPEAKHLQTLAQENADQVETVFTGALYGEEAALFLLSSDVCVIPGDIGLSALHAMYAGLPVISHKDVTSQGPEYESITPGITGDFFEKDDLSDLALKIDHWVSRTRSDKTQIQNDCIDRIRSHYTPEIQAKLIIKALNSHK